MARSVAGSAFKRRRAPSSASVIPARRPRRSVSGQVLIPNRTLFDYDDDAVRIKRPPIIFISMVMTIVNFFFAADDTRLRILKNVNAAAAAPDSPHSLLHAGCTTGPVVTDRVRWPRERAEAALGSGRRLSGVS